MERVNDRILAPTCCFRVKSWCNRWLSIDPDNLRKAKFVEKEEESCGIILLPCGGGRYMLQVLPESPGLHRDICQISSSAGVVSDTSKTVNDTAKHTCDASDFTNGDPWFLCRQGQLLFVSQTAYDVHDEGCHFSLEFDENGCVRLRSGPDNGYLTSDSKGRFWAATQKAKKWETFQLYEQALWKYPRGPSWITRAPVRVNLKAHTGRYLCAARSVICALAEAPCCCEEFLLDLSFPPMPPAWESSSKSLSKDSASTVPTSNPCSTSMETDGQATRDSIGTEKQISFKEGGKLADLSKCTIRTADGMCNLSAEADGMLSVVRVDEVQGNEFFTVELLHQKGHPKVSISHCNKDNFSNQLCYLTAERSWKLLCNKPHRRKWEEFGFELANGSRILIRSVHGGFVGSEPTLEYADTINGHYLSSSRQSRDPRVEENRLRRQCSCALKTREDVETVGAWRLRPHGDSLYTLVAVPTPRDGADVYLFVDATGRVLQSSEPGVHFPATVSLFEIKPITAACLAGAMKYTGSRAGMDTAIVGFTIRTVRKVNGKQRFLSAEPNGVLTANRLRASRWEIFQLVDVDATAATAAPLQYFCLPAAVNLVAPAAHNPLFSATRGGLAGPFIPGEQGWNGNVARGSAFLARSNDDNVYAMYATTGAIHSVEYFKKALGVAAEALIQGQAVPARVPASLQELCIRRICWQASRGCGGSQMSGSVSKEIVGECSMGESSLQVASEFVDLTEVLNSLAQLGNLLPPTFPTNAAMENFVNIPDDLVARVRTHWRSRQHPKHSCKWLPSALMAQNGHPSQNHRDGGRPRFNVQQQSLWEGNGEGWHCNSCNHNGVLNMDPSINAAHHRYLEVQYHAQSGVTQPTGFLWNLISFAGVSIMSTALLFQLFATGNRRSSRLSR